MNPHNFQCKRSYDSLGHYNFSNSVFISAFMSLLHSSSTRKSQHFLNNSSPDFSAHNFIFIMKSLFLTQTCPRFFKGLRNFDNTKI
jgi:hypothetical protein